jgi:hypothetical protein
MYSTLDEDLKQPIAMKKTSSFEKLAEISHQPPSNSPPDEFLMSIHTRMDKYFAQRNHSISRERCKK